MKFRSRSAQAFVKARLRDSKVVLRILFLFSYEIVGVERVVVGSMKGLLRLRRGQTRADLLQSFYPALAVRIEGLVSVQSPGDKSRLVMCSREGLMEMNAMEEDWFELPDQGNGEWSWNTGNSYDFEMPIETTLSFRVDFPVFEDSMHEFDDWKREHSEQQQLAVVQEGRVQSNVDTKEADLQAQHQQSWCSDGSQNEADEQLAATPAVWYSQQQSSEREAERQKDEKCKNCVLRNLACGRKYYYTIGEMEDELSGEVRKVEMGEETWKLGNDTLNS
ncbi:hypothetical protein WR25_13461 [Diploscapter pachys]|uniref:Uncharacterized protein n=1 Tax=Diploscapter pachys TaxID=2018661 RepID=A0A2A2KGQ2_9BILA|nr:hypothetical protein WR25_13461 [Diploscapter pachys]